MYYIYTEMHLEEYQQDQLDRVYLAVLVVRVVLVHLLQIVHDMPNGLFAVLLTHSAITHYTTSISRLSLNVLVYFKCFFLYLYLLYYSLLLNTYKTSSSIMPFTTPNLSLAILNASTKYIKPS